MSPHPAIARTLQRYPALGALAYGAIMLTLIAVSWLSVTHVLDQRARLAAATDFLTQLQRRWPAARHGADADTGAPPGSPFIAGQTVTVAGANLLQRVSRTITRVGGRVLSSQVDLHTAQAKPGFISVIVNCELDQPGLQSVLYDLEAGMPFLFIDHLEVQAPESSSHAQAARMHVLLSASGQWLDKR
jgi:general secretion pathway protein M